jgi:hypothetical protein
MIAGKRPVALFLGVEEADRLRLEWVFEHSEVKPVSAPGPPTAYTWESRYRPEITRLFRERDEVPALWLSCGPEHADAVRAGVDQIAAGALLGYPQCCIAAQQREKARFESAVIAGYIRDVGEDAEKIAGALLEKCNVEIDWEDDYRVPRTTARFPFVQHIACGACLSSGKRREGDGAHALDAHNVNDKGCCPAAFFAMARSPVKYVIRSAYSAAVLERLAERVSPGAMPLAGRSNSSSVHGEPCSRSFRCRASAIRSEDEASSRETPAQTMAAILEAQPAELGTAGKHVSVGVENVIAHSWRRIRRNASIPPTTSPWPCGQRWAGPKR